MYEQGEAGVELETSGQEEVRDKGVKGVTSAAAEAFLFKLPTNLSPGACPFRRVLSLVYGLARIRTGRERHWFQFQHAFWLLSNDRSARSHGAGSSLRALSIGHVSLRELFGSD